MDIKRICFILIVLSIFIIFESLIAQTNGLSNNNDSGNQNFIQPDTTVQEIVLETIEIKGKIEKPGVIIIPKRLEPKLKEKQLERSFQKEVKEGVGEIPTPEKELTKVERVTSIKKIVERERK